MSKVKILIIEDHAALLEANRQALLHEGHDVIATATLAEARAALGRECPDIIILDILLPDGNGIDFIREIRAVTTAPILILTCLNKKDDLLTGLAAGGDDYITKPYDIDELRARVAAFLRRAALAKESQRSIAFGSLTLDPLAGQAYLSGEDMLLTHKEFAILLLLVEHAGERLSKEYIYEMVWKQPLAGDDNALFKQISRLKKKLARCGSLNLSLSRGEGYQLTEEYR